MNDEKLRIVQEAKARILKGEVTLEEGSWLEWAGQDLQPGDGCTACAAGAVLYGLLCVRNEGMSGCLGFDDMCAHLGKAGFTAIEIAQIDTAFEGRVAYPKDRTHEQLLDLAMRGALEGAALHTTRALCWSLQDHQGASAQEWALAILNRMLGDGGSFIPPEYSNEQMIEILKRELGEV